MTLPGTQYNQIKYNMDSSQKYPQISFSCRNKQNVNLFMSKITAYLEFGIYC